MNCDVLKYNKYNKNNKRHILRKSINIKEVLILANRYNLKLLGYKDKLMYFNDPVTQSTIAIDNITVYSLLSTVYKLRYNWYNERSN